MDTGLKCGIRDDFWRKLAKIWVLMRYFKPASCSPPTLTFSLPQNNQLSGWYNISRKEIERRGGSRLFGHHPTLLSALRAAYPTYPWNRDNFSERRGTGRVPRGHWANKDNQKEFIERVGKELGVKEVFETFPSLTHATHLPTRTLASPEYTHNIHINTGHSLLANS